MNTIWRRGNRIVLLENGEAFFPAVFQAIENAESEVVIETFIWAEDKVGRDLQQVLITAAERGVRVTVTVDDYGSPGFSAPFLQALRRAGVALLVFDPKPRAMGVRTNLFRRLHRKLVVVDRQVGFIGGLNFSADHLMDFGPGAKQDYAVQVSGPILVDMLAAMRTTLQPAPRRFRRKVPSVEAPGEEPSGGALMALVVRDNQRCRTDIEQHYRRAVRSARREVILANAYFLPGYRLLRDLAGAVKRGVRVRLILQGQPDMPWVRAASRVLYDYLLKRGVEIYEYCRRPLHGKVALVDDEWATVGSSNLDPLSLSLNLEANLVVRDRAFTAELRARLETLMRDDCSPIVRDSLPRWGAGRMLAGVLVFHFLRRFPNWAGWFPAHRPELRPPKVPPPVVVSEPEPSSGDEEKGATRV